MIFGHLFQYPITNPLIKSLVTCHNTSVSFSSPVKSVYFLFQTGSTPCKLRVLFVGSVIVHLVLFTFLYRERALTYVMTPNETTPSPKPTILSGNLGKLSPKVTVNKRDANPVVGISGKPPPKVSGNEPDAKNTLGIPGKLSNKVSVNETDANNTLGLSMQFGGRLGNWMFQYAALYGIAARTNMSAILPPRTWLHRAFPNLAIKPTGDPSNWTLLFYPQTRIFNRTTFGVHRRGENVLLRGNFCSWKYFHHVEGEIRKEFTFANRYLRKSNQFLKNVTRDYKPRSSDDAITYIGVHVRRGDLFLDRLQHRGHVISRADYFKRGMRHFEKKYNNAVFVVCSEDKEWISENVKSNTSLVIYSPFEDAESDLCLLSKCNHTIISVGTFSWWAGWLAGGDVLYDKRFPRPDTLLWNTYRKSDYYPPGWIAL